ncbi:MAG: peptidoglycan-binding domain-containing protein [Alphaproteobacteria bacterium]
MTAALLLTACGSTSEERGITGAGLGAGAGAMLGAVTGLSVLQGAIIGTAVGGATGLLTNKDTLNIGDPVWKKKSGQAAPANTSGNTSANTPGSASAPTGAQQTVRGIQGKLAALGYKPGPADGKFGPQTSEAIRKYQRDHGLLVDGNPSPQLASHMDRQIADTR